MNRVDRWRRYRAVTTAAASALVVLIATTLARQRTSWFDPQAWMHRAPAPTRHAFARPCEMPSSMVLWHSHAAAPPSRSTPVVRAPAFTLISIINDSADRAAVVHDPGSDELRTVRVNTVIEDFTVTSITSDALSVRHDEQTWHLDLGDGRS